MNIVVRLGTILGALAAFAICATATGIVVAGALASPPREATSVDDTIPFDLGYAWAISCLPDGVRLSAATSFLIGANGALTAEVVVVTEQGVTIDTAATEATNDCLAAAKLGPDERRRGAKYAERSVIYDWARQWEVPCLSAHGVEVALPERSAFFGDGPTQWNLLDQRLDLDFGTLLAARRACPPLPPFLADDGVGW